MRTRTLIGITVVLLAVGASSAETKVSSSEKHPATVRAKKILSQKIDRWELEETPLSEVLDMVRAHGLSVYVRWVDAQIVGYEPATPITMTVSDVPLSMALRFVLQSADRSEHLDYYIDSGVIVITSAEEISEHTVIRIYEVADLVCQTRPSWSETDRTPWLRNRGLAESAQQKVHVFRPTDVGLMWGSEPAMVRPKKPIERLIDDIKESVDTLSWRPAGEEGSILALGSQLIVNATRDNHTRIAELLEGLRAARRSAEVSLGLAVVRPRDAAIAEKLREQVTGADDVGAAISGGVASGLWTIDRSSVEDATTGEPIRVGRVYRRQSRDAIVSENESVVLAQKTLAGYEVGLVATGRGADDSTLKLSFACASDCLDADADPTADTPQKNAGTFGRHDVYEFTLAPGEAKVMRVIPADARGGEVLAVVWLPAAKE